MGGNKNDLLIIVGWYEIEKNYGPFIIEKIIITLPPIFLKFHNLLMVNYFSKVKENHKKLR